MVRLHCSLELQAAFPVVLELVLKQMMMMTSQSKSTDCTERIVFAPRHQDQP
jgi:hypothetical protein